jgi:hypothetical protein
MTTTTMTIATVLSESESGTYVHLHRHNGYYAGDFGRRTACSTTRSSARTRVTGAHQTLPRTASLPRR